jgi:RNA polymerase subunit RPABC4/transcription elongation factor Spt4
MVTDPEFPNSPQGDRVLVIETQQRLVSAPEAEKTCPECCKPIPLDARVCPVCRSHIDWRRYTLVGNTTLALIIAAATVITSTANKIWEVISPKGSVINALYKGPSPNGFSFLVKNDGPLEGVIRFESISLVSPARILHGPESINIPLDNPSTTIRPREFLTLSAAVPPVPISTRAAECARYTGTGDPVLGFLSSIKLTCRINMRREDFYDPVTLTKYEVPCAHVLRLLQCVFVDKPDKPDESDD